MDKMKLNYVLLGIFIPMLFSCTNRTVYRSPNKMVSAGEEKGNWLSPKREKSFDVLVFENAMGRLHDEYRHLFVTLRTGDSNELIDLLAISGKRIQGLTPIIGNERYIPLGFPNDSQVYTVARSAELILSKDGKKLLRFQVEAASGETRRVGLSTTDMRTLPMSIGDLQHLFGKGEVTNVFHN